LRWNVRRFNVRWAIDVMQFHALPRRAKSPFFGRKALARYHRPAYFVGMNTMADDSGESSVPDKRGRWLLNWGVLLLIASSASATTAPVSGPEHEPTPTTPRSFSTRGPNNLALGNCARLNRFLKACWPARRSPCKSPLFYNLGHVRFDQGIEELKKGPGSGENGSPDSGSHRPGR